MTRAVGERYLRASLASRLTWLILVPLILLSAISAVAAYFVAVDAARRAYDRSLLDPALALARFVDVRDGQLRLALSGNAIEALRVDSSDRIFYRITDATGTVVDSNASLSAPPRIPEGETHVFFDTVLATEPMRAVVLSAPTERGRITVEVAETLVKRNLLVREVLTATLGPELVVVIAAGFLLWLGIRLGLAPLERLRAEISERSPSDLRPVAIAGVPEEVRPLVNGINDLLGRLRAAIESQRQFIGNAAHQLRTPLAGLSAHAELALREPASGELRRLLETLNAETRRTTHLVNQLLVLARAEPGASSGTERQPVDLEEVVNQAATTFVRSALEKNLDLGFDLAHAWIHGESLLVRELLANLIDNAIHYTPAGGVITVRTREEGDDSLLEVEDNGPGIPTSLRGKVMERFYRVPGSSGQGCGLGLAIVRDIAERHGARVSIDAGAGGVGTLVAVRFPRLRVEQARGATTIRG